MLEIDKIVKGLRVQQDLLSREIMLTPTGLTRNVLCDANLHIMLAISELRKLQVLDGKSIK